MFAMRMALLTCLTVGFIQPTWAGTKAPAGKKAPTAMKFVPFGKAMWNYAVFRGVLKAKGFEGLAVRYDNRKRAKLEAMTTDLSNAAKKKGLKIGRSVHSGIETIFHAVVNKKMLMAGAAGSSTFAGLKTMLPEFTMKAQVMATELLPSMTDPKMLTAAGGFAIGAPIVKKFLRSARHLRRDSLIAFAIAQPDKAKELPGLVWDTISKSDQQMAAKGIMKAEKPIPRKLWERVNSGLSGEQQLLSDALHFVSKRISKDQVKKVAPIISTLAETMGKTTISSPKLAEFRDTLQTVKKAQAKAQAEAQAE